MTDSKGQDSSKPEASEDRVAELLQKFLAECSGDAAASVEGFLRKHLPDIDENSRSAAFRKILRAALEEANAADVDAVSLQKSFPEMFDVINSLVVGAGETIAFQGGGGHDFGQFPTEPQFQCVFNANAIGPWAVPPGKRAWTRRNGHGVSGS